MFKNRMKTDDGIWEISPQEVWERRADCVLVDVRRAEEFSGELGHVQGAELITLETDFKGTVTTLDKTKDVVFICRSGGRSGQAALYAQLQGYTEVYNMRGGMLLWNELKLPTE